jgi:hypothetical protein
MLSLAAPLSTGLVGNPAGLIGTTSTRLAAARVSMQEAPEAATPSRGSTVGFVDGTMLRPTSDTPKNMEGGSMTSQILQEGLKRLDSEQVGVDLFEPATGRGWADSTEPKNQADMMALAMKQNPVIGFWDPLNIVNENTAPETIGWFRHAEIKHGRVAMAGVVGYIVHANGITFPWKIQAPLEVMGLPNVPAVSFADISAAGSPPDMWDALPTAAKVQIICVVGFLEMWSETSVALEMNGQKHYVRGGKPGYFPPLTGGVFPHPVPLNLWDPFGFTKNLSEERKEKALLAEVNNGRLAMIGMFGLLSASKGLQVPVLDTLVEGRYSGEIMAPFTAADKLPFVDYMSSFIGNLGYSL